MNEMREVNSNELAGLEGGSFSPDGDRVTPYAWPPRSYVQNGERFESRGFTRGGLTQCGIIAILIG
jgi:hypothetical protein